MDYFKEYSKDYLTEEGNSSEFKLDYQYNEKQRKSQNDYNLLRAKSNLGYDNVVKSRNNSILKALELDFNRKFSISLDC